jgi:hypothetical protein
MPGLFHGFAFKHQGGIGTVSNVPGYVHVVITHGGPDDTSTVTCVGDENGKPYSLLEIAINREQLIKAAYPGSDVLTVKLVALPKVQP